MDEYTIYMPLHVQVKMKQVYQKKHSSFIKWNKTYRDMANTKNDKLNEKSPQDIN